MPNSIAYIHRPTKHCGNPHFCGVHRLAALSSFRVGAHVESRRFGAAEKREVLRLIEVTRARTGWTIRRILKRPGLAKSRYYDWRRRADEQLLEDLFVRPRNSPYAILGEEKAANAITGVAPSVGCR